MADYTIKRNDQGIRIEILLEQQNPSTGVWAPKDFTPFAGGSAKLLLRSDTAFVWGMAQMEAGGIVRYTFDADDLDFGGTYRGEVELRSADGTIVETVPNGHNELPDYFIVEVSEDLG